MVVMGLKMVKNIPKIDYVGNFLPFLVPVTTIKTLQKYFYLVVEVLSFDLVGHMWKFVKNWFEKCIFCGKFLWEILVEKSCGKISWENLVGNSCGKLLLENLVGNSCGKILWEILAGKSCGKILQEILVGNVTGKYSFLKPILNRLSHMTHQIEA